MSMTMTRTEEVTVVTMTSNNPKSTWPLLCQILGTLCYSPACSVSHKLRGLLGATQSALGTAQIMIGLLNIAIGSIMHAQFWYYSPLTDTGAPFWLGAMFILFGVMCILAEKCPSACLVVITGLMNFVSAVFAFTAIVLYAINIARERLEIAEYYGDCARYDYYNIRSSPKTPSEYYDICKTYRAKSRVILQAMSIIMIIFAALQLCIAISAGVMAFKAVCKRETSVQDPELNSPLVNEVLSYPTV
ncbi:B-lymphocyte antigen CD20-like [Sardina pilchardus]|uniref:B-lymphocyte antigen CD20-like n=1 Tax=Sardina pilchardus TaxID=27697 RepID=UPI002E108569